MSGFIAGKRGSTSERPRTAGGGGDSRTMLEQRLVVRNELVLYVMQFRVKICKYFTQKTL